MRSAQDAAVRDICISKTVCVVEVEIPPQVRSNFLTSFSFSPALAKAPEGWRSPGRFALFVSHR
ncbi:MAG: hypothetical protein WBN22_06355 [Verrucomicrobiia bacterium]